MGQPCSTSKRTVIQTIKFQPIILAVKAARTAYDSWSQLSCHERARHLYNLARHIQKHSRLIAVIEALDNGKSIRETRDADVMIVVRHLYYYAGWAELLGEQVQNILRFAFAEQDVHVENKRLIKHL